MAPGFACGSESWFAKEPIYVAQVRQSGLPSVFRRLSHGKLFLLEIDRALCGFVRNGILGCQVA